MFVLGAFIEQLLDSESRLVQVTSLAKSRVRVSMKRPSAALKRPSAAVKRPAKQTRTECKESISQFSSF